MDTYDYSEIIKISGPGHVISNFNHPILQNLSHPVFKKILTYTDQVIFILNHSKSEFVYISENVLHVLGIPAETYKLGGAKFTFERLHPDDLKALQDTVLPEYYRYFDSLLSEQKFRMKSTFTVRFRKPDGTYIRLLQQNIPLTVENGKVGLGLIVSMDISVYKKDDLVTYKNVLIDELGCVRVLSQGMHKHNFNLTDREITILQLTANGLSEKHISDQLTISIHTVKSHRKNMMRKAGVKNAVELVKYGMANLLL